MSNHVVQTLPEETWKQAHAIPTYVTSRKNKKFTFQADTAESLGARVFSHFPLQSLPKGTSVPSAYQRVLEQERAQRAVREKIPCEMPAPKRKSGALPVQYFFSPPGMGDDFAKPIARRQGGFRSR